MDRLPILKALGDNTRYAIYLEVARAARPVSTAEIAETLGLHPNTVRPHLERMREVGLLEVEVESRGQVGRPQHRYSLAPDAPSLGLEPPAFPMLARMLGAVAAAAGAEPDDAVAVGREQGRAAAREHAEREHAEREQAEREQAEREQAEEAHATEGAGAVAALCEALEVLGFDPALGTDGDTAVVAFAHCPYRDLAETYPELVCHLHRGWVEGFVAELGGVEVESFNTLADREPCQVLLAGSM